MERVQKEWIPDETDSDRHTWKNGLRHSLYSRADRWKNGFGYTGQGVVGKAIQKYGWENFNHTILETVETQLEADEKEKYYITFYDCLAQN